jgi:hypothetical protein
MILVLVVLKKNINNAVEKVDLKKVHLPLE